MLLVPAFYFARCADKGTEQSTPGRICSNKNYPSIADEKPRIENDFATFTLAPADMKQNCITSFEAFSRLKKYGFEDVIKLDGGGSFILDHEGTNVAVTDGNRNINTVGLY